MNAAAPAPALIGSNSAVHEPRAYSAELIEALAAVAIDQLRALRSTMRLDNASVGELAEHETFHNVEVLLFAMRTEADRIGNAPALADTPPC